jgi:hypothetical protein
LDLNFRKEQFSAAYVRALAAVAGLSVARPEPDCDSEDLILSARLAAARIRSPKLAVQLKCSSSLAKLPNDVAFLLPIKNYDDLRPVNLAVPRVLVVVKFLRETTRSIGFTKLMIGCACCTPHIGRPCLVTDQW